MAKEFFKENILRLRSSKKWSQQELADKAGVSYHTVFRAEAGVVPRGPNIGKLAKALQVSESDLFKDSYQDLKSVPNPSKTDLIGQIVLALASLDNSELVDVLDIVTVDIPSRRTTATKIPKSR